MLHFLKAEKNTSLYKRRTHAFFDIADEDEEESERVGVTVRPRFLEACEAVDLALF